MAPAPRATHRIASEHGERDMQILQLSDLHYGCHKDEKPRNTGFGHIFENHVAPAPEALLDILRRTDRVATPPDAVVVSGDIGWNGDTVDYGFALQFLGDLRTLWKGTSFVIVPG